MSSANTIRYWPRRLLVVLVRGYQLSLSLLIGRQCRFHPTCSHYAMTALERFGARRGTMLAAKRIARCHPWHPGGIDEVPEIDPPASSATEAPCRADNHVQCAAPGIRLPDAMTNRPDIEA